MLVLLPKYLPLKLSLSLTNLGPCGKKLISQVITIARKHKRKIGICGQAPSDFPDFARFLVREKIDSISLVPDTVVKTTLAILSEEKKMRR